VVDEKFVEELALSRSQEDGSLSAHCTHKKLQQGVPGLGGFCQIEISKQTRCRDFPCQTWKLVSSVMLLMTLLKAALRFPVFTDIYTCCDEEGLLESLEGKK